MKNAAELVIKEEKIVMEVQFVLKSLVSSVVLHIHSEIEIENRKKVEEIQMESRKIWMKSNAYRKQLTQSTEYLNFFSKRNQSNWLEKQINDKNLQNQTNQNKQPEATQKRIILRLEKEDIEVAKVLADLVFEIVNEQSNNDSDNEDLTMTVTHVNKDKDIVTDDNGEDWDISQRKRKRNDTREEENIEHKVVNYEISSPEPISASSSSSSSSTNSVLPALKRASEKMAEPQKVGERWHCTYDGCAKTFTRSNKCKNHCMDHYKTSTVKTGRAAEKNINILDRLHYQFTHIRRKTSISNNNLVSTQQMTSNDISNQILQQQYLYLQQMRQCELKQQQQQQQSNQGNEGNQDGNKNDSEDRNDWIQLIRYEDGT